MSHKQNRNLIEALMNCTATCNHCIAACLEEDNVAMLTDCIRLDIDCAEICALAVGFISRGSAHAEHVLAECADICEACATECSKHAHMDHCRECAEACRKCAELCHTGVAA